MSPELPRPSVAAIVPVLDEAQAIGDVVTGVLGHGVTHVIVVAGGSTDATRDIATRAGAHVILEQRRGYGRAMMTGISTLPDDIAVVLFFDGDGSDRTECVPLVLAPILAGTADFAMGSRLQGPRESGSLGAAQIVAGRLAGFLIWVVYGVRFTDMSPFRALRREVLEGLNMRESTFGWNLEMQMKIAAARLDVIEIAVGQLRRRGGTSKVSGNLQVTIRAAWIIARTFIRIVRSGRKVHAPSPSQRP
ncbi:MAG: glycosyltransferase family 2 protein [Hyphomicrobiaceae bacterium]